MNKEIQMISLVIVQKFFSLVCKVILAWRRWQVHALYRTFSWIHVCLELLLH